VSVSGDYAVVGANENDDAGSNSGSAYIFVRSGTTWTQQQKLTASDAASSDHFGRSVSVSGDYAVVGAVNDNSGEGSAYIFVRSGTTWTQQQKLTASDAASNDYFGISVSVSGDYAVVGAHGDNSGEGSAYIFVRSGTTWTQQQKLTASDAASNDYFGASASLSGDYAVVGAYGDNSGEGSAYIFVRSGTTWTQQQKLTASDAASNDYFGASASLSGDYAVVGAYGDNSGEGSAYIFVRSGTTWTQQQKLTASDAASNDYFGASASLSGDYAVVGAYGDNSGQGSAYIFVRSGTTWSQQQKLTASDAASYDSFGISVSVSEDYAVVGAEGTNGGSAYAFVMNCDASTAPTNGGVGSCTNSLASGSTCQPTCNSGYTVSGTSSYGCRVVHEFVGVWVYVPADVQQRVHGVRDELVQRGHFDRGDVLGESMRRVYGSHQRWRRVVHEFIGVWVYVPADVQQRVHGVRDELVQRGHFDRGDVRCHKYDEWWEPSRARFRFSPSHRGHFHALLKQHTAQ
jgi:hypothetical protein